LAYALESIFKKPQTCFHEAPARGSKAWQASNQRTALERDNAYLKEFFQLNNVTDRSGKRAKVTLI